MTPIVYAGTVACLCVMPPQYACLVEIFGGRPSRRAQVVHQVDQVPASDAERRWKGLCLWGV